MDSLDLGSKKKLDIQLVNRKGWWVPPEDQCAQDIILREVNDLDVILPYCKQFRSCIQAGGNIGIWDVALSKKFDKVYTAEPDAANYLALIKNTEAFINIQAFNCAFGRERGTGSIHVHEPGNIGAHQVTGGDAFEIIPIDELGVTDCDLLQLDVEGYEHFALLGAVETITASSPVICLELKGIGEKYGYTNEATIFFLETLGYKVATKIHNDYVFTKV